MDKLIKEAIEKEITAIWDCWDNYPVYMRKVLKLVSKAYKKGMEEGYSKGWAESGKAHKQDLALKE